jgi:sugar lactone lactonase YvrE
MNGKLMRRGLIAAALTLQLIWADASPIAGADYQWVKSFGEYASVEGVAIDSAGNLWAARAANTGGNFVAEYAAAGNVLRQFNTDAGGRFCPQPMGLAIDLSGNVWVGDWSHTDSEIWEYSPDGNHLNTYLSGSNPSSSSNITGVAVDSMGNIYGCGP